MYESILLAFLCVCTSFIIRKKSTKFFSQSYTTKSFLKLSVLNFFVEVVFEHQMNLVVLESRIYKSDWNEILARNYLKFSEIIMFSIWYSFRHVCAIVFSEWKSYCYIYKINNDKSPTCFNFYVFGNQTKFILYFTAERLFYLLLPKRTTTYNSFQTLSYE